MVDHPKLRFGRANWSQGQTVEDLWGKQDPLARRAKVRDKHAAKNRGAEYFIEGSECETARSAADRA